jgi:hypothetical protein
LVCVMDKTAEDNFAISDWQPANGYTQYVAEI